MNRKAMGPGLFMALTAWAVGNSAFGVHNLREKDLAIIMPLEEKGLITTGGNTQLGRNLLPSSWYQSLHAAYLKTSIGDALMSESRYEDWTLVSLRIAPCAPLGLAPSQKIDDLCWPEVRLVWQPVLRKITLHARYMEAAGEDRSVHAIYPVAPTVAFLKGDEAKEAQNFLQKIKDAVTDQGNPETLTAAEIERFRTLRNRTSRELLNRTLSLRASGIDPTLYEQHGTRPEFARGEGTPFLAKLGEFLRDFAQPGHLQTLTSFSLPAGREPAHLDEWVFLSFKGEKGKIVPLPIAIHSKKDGRKLLSLTSSMRGTMARDDEALYEPFADEVAAELKETVMLRVPDIRRLASILQDRKQILVPNTSCISCHKMNSERFDFHNLSYLEDRDISISPRVKRDVELDRSWITDFLSDD